MRWFRGSSLALLTPQPPGRRHRKAGPVGRSHPRPAGHRRRPQGCGEAVGNRRQAVENGGRSCEEPTNSSGTRRMFGEPLARRIPEGIELLPRPPGNRGAGRLGDEDPHDTHQLAGAWRSGWVTRPLGPKETSASTGSVTGTGHPKGPCDSYSQGPFTISGCFPQLSSRPWSPRSIPLNHGENSQMPVEYRQQSVEQPANFGGTRRMFAEPLARPCSEGIELLPRPPGNREAGQLGDEGPHGAEPACWGRTAAAG